jgi:hypothetical protein
MKIVHMCLSCFYIDGYFYQENEIIRQNVDDGHDVVVIASTESYDVSLRLDVTENNGNTQNEVGGFDAGSGGTMYFRNLVTSLSKDNTKESLYRVRNFFTATNS